MCAVLLPALALSVRAAPEFIESFEGDQQSWIIAPYDPSAARVLSHVRHRGTARQGNAAERIEIDVSPPLTSLTFEHKLPPSLLIDEMQLALWVRCNRDGAALAVRVVFPNQTDPRTGTPLTTTLAGDAYAQAKIGQWQQLHCRDLKRQLERKLPLLRNKFQSVTSGSDIDIRGAYVDRAIVNLTAYRGTTEIYYDDLHLSPAISPAPQSGIQRVSATETALAPEVEFRLDKLLFRGKEFFPRVVPYHGEGPDELASMRFNIAWVPSYQDEPLLLNLRKNGLGAMATPPVAGSADGPPLDDSRASLAPFGPETQNILFWNLGTRIPGAARREVALRVEQVRNADRQLQRPLLADVAGSERSYSRQVSMLGTSKHIYFGGITLKAYRDWLIERRNLAQPGTFQFTWTHTEPLLASTQARRAANVAPQVVEPEQMRLQLYAALSAGCRGIGWWTNTPLDVDTPGSRERRAMLTQLNMELELLEKWIAGGTLQDPPIKFTVKPPPQRDVRQLNLPFGTTDDLKTHSEALLRERANQKERENRLQFELEAAAIRSEYGLLVLPVWYGETAQYVPPQLAANDATIIIPGVEQSAAAYEVSTTDIRNLTMKPVAGGRQIVLPKFNMTTAIIVTTNKGLIDELRERIKPMSERSAQVSLEMTRAKLERVAEVDAQLQKLEMGQLDSLTLLTAAKVKLERAQEAFRKQDFHGARLQCNDTLQLLRELQYACWIDAIRNLDQPVSSPHALCFQTLPDHWRMIASLGKSNASSGRNVLRTGDFENFDAMLADGWKHEQTPVEGVQAAAELYPRPHGGSYCLRLIAIPDTGIAMPIFIDERPVTVTTPPLPVSPGQAVFISGWVRVVTNSVGNIDGVLLYDNVGGPASALRWKKSGQWQQFSLIREAPPSGELTLTMTLAGLGEVFFDDLRVVPYDVDQSAATKPKAPATPRSPLTAPRDMLKWIPGMGK